MFDQVLSYILLYKYFALFLITFLGSLTNLMPASPSLIISGALIAIGHLNYFQVFLFGYLGVTLGDICGYFLSYFFSKEILIKIGFKKLINSRSFKKAERIFEKNAGKTIFFSRFFLSSFGPIINLVAGFAKINYKKFIFYDAMGEIIYIFLLTGIGYLFANNRKHVIDIINYLNFVNYIIIIIVIFIILVIISRFRNKKRIDKLL